MKEVAILLVTILSLPTYGAALSLTEYLESVKVQNESYKAAKENQEGAHANASEGKLIYSPNLFATAQLSEDAKPFDFTSPAFSYQSVDRQYFQLGLSQNSSIGLNGKFYYQLTQTTYRGLSPTFVDGRPTLELTQSLWRNDFGRETRAQVTAAVSEAKASEFKSSFERQSLLLQAEMSYWRLALARQNAELAKENLSRAERLFAWAKKRVGLSLADRSDSLQTGAALQIRKIEMKSAGDELRSASQAFNLARGVESDEVKESLDPLSKDVLSKLKIPERASDRQDTLAAREVSEVSKARATLGRERNQPTLELYGSYSFNSREDTKSDAFSQSWDGNLPSKVVGLRFSTPLAFGKMSDTQTGYSKLAKAAELDWSRKKFVQELDWRDLVNKFNETKERLAAAEELEGLQKEKLEHERSRHEKGRTTLFQVLTFESEYSSAQSTRLRFLAELLQIAAQMKLYGVNYESSESIN